MGSEMCIRDSNQSLNIKTNNSISEDVSFQINKSFPNMKSKQVNGGVSPLLSGKKPQHCTLQEMGNLNLRIGHYERRKAELKAKIEEQLRLKNQRESSKQGGLFHPYNISRGKKEMNQSGKVNRSFQKNIETLSLKDKFRKTSEVNDLSLLGELDPVNIRDPFGDTSNLKCRNCLLYTSPSPRDLSTSRMPSSA